jgi:hypothetical protein
MGIYLTSRLSVSSWPPKLPSSSPDAHWTPLEAWHLGYIHPHHIGRRWGTSHCTHHLMPGSAPKIRPRSAGFDHWPLRGPQERVGLREEASRSHVQPSSRKAQKLKVHSPGLRALAAESAPSAARAVGSRCLRLFSFLCQSCRCFLDHFFIVAALGPESVPLVCGLHDRHEMGCYATQTTLIDVVHGGMYVHLRAPHVPHLYAGLDTRTMRPLRIQFRSNSVCYRLPLRRAPAVDLSSQGPGQWGQHNS